MNPLLPALMLEKPIGEGSRARGFFDRHSYEFLLPVELMTDINNDGKIGDEDNSLASKANESGATEEDKDKGTEFLFYNDDLSNGLWDKDDPDAPASEKDDDDAQEISIKLEITKGEVWLEHPAIDGLSFYESRECKDSEKINLSPSSKFTISDQNPFPNKVFMRADGDIAFPPNDPQFVGNLVLKIKLGSKEIEAAKIKLTVVKEFGAKKYFHAVRDIIYEDNLKMYVAEKDYGATKFRMVFLCAENSQMHPVETFNQTPKLWGIDDVSSKHKFASVVMNGNNCFFSTGNNTLMTDRCLGRLVQNGVLNTTVSVTGSAGLGGGLTGNTFRITDQLLNLVLINLARGKFLLEGGK